eukprot:6603555-Lingulodinium_polyedra.AAC.1
MAKTLSETKKASEDAEEYDEQAAEVFVNRNDLGQKKQKKGPATWDVVIPMKTIAEEIEA